MQRHGNDDIKMMAANALVIDGGAEPARHEMAQMHLPAVFEIENDTANNSATAISSDRGVEVQGAMRAIRAIKRTGDRAGEWLRTFRTKWRNNADDFVIACVAKI